MKTTNNDYVKVMYSEKYGWLAGRGTNKHSVKINKFGDDLNAAIEHIEK